MKTFLVLLLITICISIPSPARAFPVSANKYAVYASLFDDGYSCITITSISPSRVTGLVEMHLVSSYVLPFSATARRDRYNTTFTYSVVWRGSRFSDLVTYHRNVLNVRKPGDHPLQGVIYYRVPYRSCARWATDF